MANTPPLNGQGKPLFHKTVADATNHNLSGPQKELLQCHWKLGINVSHVQELMRERLYKVPGSNDIMIPSVLNTMHATSRYCSVLKCLACGISAQKLRSPNVKTSRQVKLKECVLKHNHYEQ